MQYIITDPPCIEWKAKWIWKGKGIKINDFSYLRKEFCLAEQISGARVYVSAHNHFELYINGEKISGYVVPAPSHPEKSKYYLCYDVTDLLRPGVNSFCAIVHFMGGGGQNYVNGLPGFILQCSVDYNCGKSEDYITDDTWRTLDKTPFRNGTVFQQPRLVTAIEDYDARKEPTGWLQAGFDDSHWDKAVLSAINKHGWVMKPQEIPEGNIHEVIVPVAVGVHKKGIQVFDCGKIVAGWPRLDLAGIEGVQIMLRYSEDINGKGRVKHNVCNVDSENYYDLYTMKGGSQEVWEPCFSYKAFRYVEVTGYPGMISSENIKIISAGTGISYKGFFSSSNRLLNEIYQACIQTQKNNVLGQMVDCPHREQAQYLADSDLQAETFTYNFTDQSVLRKVLLDFKDIQFEDGRLPFVFPTNIDNPEWNIKIPEWDFHYVTLLWKIYFIYDDSDILKICYNSAKKIVNYYHGIRNEETGLTPKAEGWPTGWNISDHPYPNIDESGKYLTVENCKLYNTTLLMSKIAYILGFEADVREFDEKAASLRECIQKHLYQPGKNLFIDCFGSEQANQGTQVVALQYGLVSDGDKQGILDFIARKGLDCSTLLSLNLLQVLFENGKEMEAYNLLNRTEQPGWGYMIEKGYKTVWEGFMDIESHSHAWNAYPARIFAEYLLGIKAAAPGFSEVIIRPYLPSGMQFAEGRVPTTRGDIYVKWEVNSNDIDFKVCIPSGTVASLFILTSENKPEVIIGPMEFISKVKLK